MNGGLRRDCFVELVTVKILHLRMIHGYNEVFYDLNLVVFFIYKLIVVFLLLRR